MTRKPPKIELPNRPLLPWQQEAVAMRRSGVSKSKIAIALGKSDSQLSLLLYAKCRKTDKDYRTSRYQKNSAAKTEDPHDL